MNFWNASAPARPAARASMVALTASALILAVGSTAFAQLPKAAPKQLPKSQPPAPAPAQPQAAAGDQPPQLIYSPWTKFCLKGQEANAQQVCFTGRDGSSSENGQLIVAAVVIEPEGQPNKILRITLPLGVMLTPGTRVIVDQGQPLNGPYIICFTNGCMADYEASAELIGKMKKGQILTVQGIDGNRQPLSVSLPLSGFDKAYDGPPTDLKVAQEQQEKMRDELLKRAEEARKKQEAQQPPTR